MGSPESRSIWEIKYRTDAMMKRRYRKLNIKSILVASNLRFNKRKVLQVKLNKRNIRNAKLKVVFTWDKVNSFSNSSTWCIVWVVSSKWICNYSLIFFYLSYYVFPYFKIQFQTLIYYICIFIRESYKKICIAMFSLYVYKIMKCQNYHVNDIWK